MTDINLLNLKIKESGLKKEYIAEQLGINNSSLSRKLNNKLQFKSLEIKEMCSLLNIQTEDEKNKIFFAQ